MLIAGLNKRKFQLLLFVLMMINSQLVMVFPFSSIFNNGWSLSWMITVFLFGSYIGKYGLLENFKNTSFLGGWLLSIIILRLSAYIPYGIVNIQYNQWFFFLKSLCMFMWIKNIKLTDNCLFGKIVGFLSPNVLSIYLIHNQVLLLPVIISFGATLIPIGTSALLQTVLLSVSTLCVMLGCIFIDKIRTWIFVKINITALENKFCSAIDYKIRLWVNAI